MEKLRRALFAAAEDVAAPRPAENPYPRPAPVYPRVLLVIHDPVAQNGRKVRRLLHWNDPDTLVHRYIDDVGHASYGYANYEIVARVVVDGFPVKEDGFVYTADSYLRAWQNRAGFHQPDRVDTPRLLQEFDVMEKINHNQIDEVWLFGFPYAGYYESMMVGPDAFWCNAPPLPDSRYRRRFVVMGFSYERGVGEMLENLGHRAESIMDHVYRHRRGSANLWQRFIRTEKSHPGRAECGNVHFAPNSERDYDWGNPRPVMSRCDDWYNFPDLQGTARRVNCRQWGNGDMRQHHLWWLRHFPHVAGETEGISNNWWQYVIDPNRVAE